MLVTIWMLRKLSKLPKFGVSYVSGEELEHLKTGGKPFLFLTSQTSMCIFCLLISQYCQVRLSGVAKRNPHTGVWGTVGGVGGVESWGEGEVCGCVGVWGAVGCCVGGFIKRHRTVEVAPPGVEKNV